MSNQETRNEIDRRNFLRSSAAVGAGLVMSQPLFAETQSSKKPDDINVALLGAGAQGQVLMNACLKMGSDSGIRFKAVCDIWTKQNQKRATRMLKKFGHVNNTYVDYREMLAKEKDLDAVIVATPDFWHGEHAIACLKAGLHVYCEKEMSNTLENARKIVDAAKETGKLLQIGHQRRSNPRYIYCYEKLIKEAKLLGQITTINGQWNRSRAACIELDCRPGTEIEDSTLKKYGFNSMKQFMNWRWYKGLGGGPIVDLGSHQIDIYSWFLEAQPKSVIASGGIDYWTSNEWYDNVVATFEYQTESGTVRATYQTLTTNSSGGYYEQFMGDHGTLEISEDPSRCGVFREMWVEEAEWYKWENKRYIKRVGGLGQPAVPSKAVLDLRFSPSAAKYSILVEMNQPFHQPHLQNFFDSIRGKATLNCPAEIGYETAVSVLKVNEAVREGRRLEFKPEEFHV